MAILLEVCELMGEQDLLAELLENVTLMSEKSELVTIYKMSRMSDEERLLAFGKTFRKIKEKLSREANRLRREESDRAKAEQNAEYEKGEKTNMARAKLRNTLRAKREKNTELYKQWTVPQNIKRILQQGKYAKPENAKRAKNFMNARGNMNNITRRLAKYNAMEANLAKHYSLENYQRMLANIE